MNIEKLFEEGKIYTEKEVFASILTKYGAHKTFKGVYLKHLVRGEMTEKQLSCHLVKIEPFCTLEEHTHSDNLEIHQVIAGNGAAVISGTQTEYSPGAFGVIPANAKHKVTAGKDGLYILATFSPALL